MIMKKSEFMEYINSMISHILFEFNGKDCGVDPFSANSYDVWYGDELKNMKSIDDVMNSPFFDGKSLSEIYDEIENLSY